MMHQNNNYIPLNVPHNSTIIIGFSGGPDSLYLLIHLKQLEKSHNLKLVAAHLDHEWRKESAQEALWCKQVCINLGVEFIQEKASNIIINKKINGSQEQLARYKRRTFFETLAQHHDRAYIALAHHKDDQIETFFIRLARGTSLQGLSGIKENDGLYIRPLLHVYKQQILDYLTNNNISYIKDPTNLDTTFLRNSIRHKLMPILPLVDRRLPEHIVTTMQHLADVNDLLDQLTKETITHITTYQDPLSLDIKHFLELHSILQQRIMLQMLIKANATFTPSQALFSEIVRFLQTNKNNAHHIHTNYKIIKRNKSFFIVEISTHTS